jgi:hypothetical protein
MIKLRSAKEQSMRRRFWQITTLLFVSALSIAGNEKGAVVSGSATVADDSLSARGSAAGCGCPSAKVHPAYTARGLIHRLLSMTNLIIGIFPIIAVIVERPQEVPEDPVGHLSSLLTPRLVREAEVDALVDTCIDLSIAKMSNLQKTKESQSLWLLSLPMGYTIHGRR